MYVSYNICIYGFTCRKVREDLVQMPSCGGPIGAQAAIDRDIFHHVIYTLNLKPF